MVVSKNWLDNKIKELNEWLTSNENHEDYSKNKYARDYYVNKIIDLEENQQTTIKV